MTSFLISGNHRVESKFQFDEIVGEYGVYKTEVIEEYSKGWNYSKRYERKLILMKDSTYKEINTTFEAFDMVDFYGTWSLSNNTVTLQPKGILDYNNGKWTPNRDSNFDRLDLSESKLKVDTEGRLEILKDGFLRSEKLIKLVTVE
ncbi:hypothetical protein [Crocinitomix catalasitica]|uniref:hypothetical protein n=1 Tax=Crocinitomix catalasitica TaxID=184607 RepID=UPI0012FBD5D8|nr:hypothetical protein [Crocinitomix catalasitica]